MTHSLSEARFRIAGFGTACPSGVVTNSDLGERFGIDVGWIESRCGIQSRNVAGPGESTQSLGVAAASQALARAGAARPDCFICATFTPEYQLCPTAHQSLIVWGSVRLRRST